MSQICWFLKNIHAKELQPLWTELSKFGFSSIGQDYPSDLSCYSVATEIPDDSTLIVICNASASDASALTAKIRESEAARFRWIPILGAWTEETEVPGEELAHSGIDDICSLKTSPRALAQRLKLRQEQAKQKESIFRASQEQLAQVAKVETAVKQREEFLSVCAHDLRSPLGLIQSSLAMVLNAEKNKASLPPLYTELMTRAKRQAGHAITLVNDLLDVMALEQGLKPRYHLIRLDDLLSEFFKDYSFQAEQKNIRFHYENPVAEWRVLADSDRIRQLLQNLFANALKFTDPGKNIYLKVRSFQGRRKTDPPFPMLIFSLQDEGRGIPQGEIQKIFDRFTQLKDQSRAEGRGLGLTVSKQISNLHDGNLWVESVEGQGSTFFVLLPHTISRVAQAQENPAVKRWLIVEPTVSKREALFSKWQKEGVEFIFARDGVEAITLLFHWKPDALILTPNLAKIDEVEVANIAKGDSLTSSIPIFLALEQGQKLQKKHENMLYDESLQLPLSFTNLFHAFERLKRDARAA